MVFSYAKTGSAVFLSHLSMIEVFSTAFARAGIAAEYTQGFNPMPRLSFASPAALGLAADNEIASIDLDRPVAAEAFIAALNAVLPEGVRVKNALCVTIATGEKKVAVPAILWGFVYRNPLSGGEDYVRHGDDRAYRDALLEKTSLLRLCRTTVLAQARGEDGVEYQDYFAYYAARYPHD